MKDDEYFRSLTTLNKNLLGLNSKRNSGPPRMYNFANTYGPRYTYFTIPKHFLINITPNNYVFPHGGGTKQFTVSLSGTSGYKINDQNPVTIKFISGVSMNTTFIDHSDDNTNFAPPYESSDYGTEITFNNTTETKTFSLHSGPTGIPGTQTGNLISVLPVQIGSKIVHYNPTWNIIQDLAP